MVDALDGNILFINVMNRLSIDCDCDGNPSEPDIHDIGILASTDPVALDQACVDLIYQAEGNENFVRRDGGTARGTRSGSGRNHRPGQPYLPTGKRGR